MPVEKNIDNKIVRFFEQHIQSWKLLSRYKMLTKSLRVPLENLNVLFHKQIYFNMTLRYACTCTCQNERFRIYLEVA